MFYFLEFVSVIFERVQLTVMSFTRKSKKPLKIRSQFVISSGDSHGWESIPQKSKEINDIR